LISGCVVTVVVVVSETVVSVVVVVSGSVVITIVGVVRDPVASGSFVTSVEDGFDPRLLQAYAKKTVDIKRTATIISAMIL
jgi:hydrogenase maturation factor